MGQCRICGKVVPDGAVICPACSLDATRVSGGGGGKVVLEKRSQVRLEITPASLRWVAHLTLWPGVALLGLAFFLRPSSRWAGLEEVGVALAAFGLMWFLAVRAVRKLQEKVLREGSSASPPAPPRMRTRACASFPANVPATDAKGPLMPLRLYNTMSQKKEEFSPLQSGEARMYACGVTVYDFCHIGHARAAVAFDVIRRHLADSGFRVTYVRNYTDIDDKIIKRANETGKTWKEVAETYIAAHDQDMAALGVRRADHEPKATGYIREIVATVQKLVDRGFAYTSEGDVYFEVRKFAGYGKLSHRDIEELEAGARVAVGERKRDPLDFALWKGSKPGEPSWESPWGPGRPGWHIECSAMSSALLGETFDIHGGGMDLIFPHHENELAQSEAANGKTFARYWMHNGFVNINNEKMSKSLGNFFTIREVLEKFRPEVVRFFLLGTHYRSPLDFSDAALSEARVRLERFAQLFARLTRLPLEERAPNPLEAEALRVLRDQVGPAFREAMDDDFNTAGALGHLFTALPPLNAVADAADAAGSGVSSPFLQEVDLFFRDRGGVLGVFEEGLAWGAAFLGGGGPPAEVAALAEARQAARKAKDFLKADEIRDRLAALGWTVQDTPHGPVPVPLKR